MEIKNNNQEIIKCPYCEKRIDWNITRPLGRLSNKRLMKCCICYSEELGKVSDIEDSDKRFEALNDFFMKIQEIVRRETEIEFLKGWRKIKLVKQNFHD